MNEEIEINNYGVTFGLFDTISLDETSPNFQADVTSQVKNIPSGKIEYGDNLGTILPKDLPRQFDTRNAVNFPEKERPKWFYQDRNGYWESILTWPIDQAGCGSCWAFSTASNFSDVIRFNLLRIYGPEVVKKSIFFRPNIVCTGETNVTTDSAGVVNSDQVKIYATETFFNVSAYFTVAFSPKIKNVVDQTTQQQRTILDNQCNDVIDEWKATITTPGRSPQDLKQLLNKDYLPCMGCGGNLIVCALMLCVGDGIALGPDFPLHEWACLWGNSSIREKFCSPNYIVGSEVRDFPKLYHADYYSYITASKAIPPNIRRQGIRNMTDWMMMSIYFYGPITIGFTVYQSFLKFFSKKENAKKVYTADQFIYDYQQGGNTAALGGHAVVIVGWGESKLPDGTVVPYWIVRNSWGIKWADGGFFAMERGMDTKLSRAGVPLIRFEYEFGNIYFNPYPAKAVSNGQVNEMKEYLMPIPAAHLPVFRETPELVEEMNYQCNCRCGYHYNSQNKVCESLPHDYSKNHYTDSLLDLEKQGLRPDQLQATTFKDVLMDDYGRLSRVSDTNTNINSDSTSNSNNKIEGVKITTLNDNIDDIDNNGTTKNKNINLNPDSIVYPVNIAGAGAGVEPTANVTATPTAMALTDKTESIFENKTNGIFNLLLILFVILLIALITKKILIDNRKLPIY